MSNWKEHPWMGVFATTLCLFHEDESLDEAGLRAYIRELALLDFLLNEELPIPVSFTLMEMKSVR